MALTAVRSGTRKSTIRWPPSSAGTLGSLRSGSRTATRSETSLSAWAEGSKRGGRGSAAAPTSLRFRPSDFSPFEVPTSWLHSHSTTTGLNDYLRFSVVVSGVVKSYLYIARSRLSGSELDGIIVVSRYFGAAASVRHFSGIQKNRPRQSRIGLSLQRWGDYICNKCGHTTHLSDVDYECSCRNCLELVPAVIARFAYSFLLDLSGATTACVVTTVRSSFRLPNTLPH